LVIEKLKINYKTRK